MLLQPWCPSRDLHRVDDGVVTAFIPDPRPNGGASFPEGITVDKKGVTWGGSIGDRNVSQFVRNEIWRLCIEV